MEQYYPKIMLALNLCCNKMILTFESVDEILLESCYSVESCRVVLFLCYWYYRLNEVILMLESADEILTRGTVDHAVQGGGKIKHVFFT